MTPFHCKQPVVLFLIDGLRPDALQQAHTPALHALMDAGAHTLAAHTVMPSISLPCIFSLFSGRSPDWHGIRTNLWTPPLRPSPTVFDRVHAAGGQAVVFYDWEELRDLGRPGALQASFFVRMADDDPEAADVALTGMAVDYLGRQPFDFAFVYLGSADEIGHKHGWMSPAYLAAVETCDRCVGRVLAALPSGCAVVALADHGGHDHAHGSDCPADLTIPIVVRAADVPPGTPLAAGMSILDVAPRVAELLGLPWDAD